MQFRQCSIHGQKYEEVGGMLCEVSPTEQSMPVHILKVSIKTRKINIHMYLSGSKLNYTFIIN
jgi:hypothetical protein